MANKMKTMLTSGAVSIIFKLTDSVNITFHVKYFSKHEKKN